MFLTFFLNCFSQGRSGLPDSIRIRLETMPFDTNRALYLTQSARTYWGSNPDWVIELASEALRISDSLGFKKGRASALNSLGYGYLNSGRYAEALDRFQACLAVSKETGFKPGIGGSLQNIGTVYFRVGKFGEALESYLENKKLQEEWGNKQGVADMDLNIGNIYYRLNELEKALKNYNEAFEINTSLNNKEMMATCLGNIGTIQDDEGKLVESLNNRIKALKLFEEIQNKAGIANSFTQIAQIEGEMGKVEEGILNAEKAVKLFIELNNKEGHAAALLQLGELQSQAGQNSEALRSLSAAKKIGEDIRNIQIQIQAAKALSEAHNQAGHAQMALDFFKEYRRLDDSLKNENNKRDILLKDYMFEMDKKILADSLEEVRKAEIAEQKLDQQRIVSWFGALGVVLMSLVAILLFRGYRNKEKANQIISAEQQKSETLLLNILPKDIAQELKLNGRAEPRNIPDVTVMFTDFEGFTRISGHIPAAELVKELDQYFSAFDAITVRYGLEKIKTIGDSFMCAGGLFGDGQTSCENVVKAAAEMLRYVQEKNESNRAAGKEEWNIRIGIHSGEVIAGVVGKTKFAFDIWGDTVNTASRMESAGKLNCVSVSAGVYERLKNKFSFRYAGKATARNKGELDVYLLDA